jgi:hypothetical protein
MADWPNVGVSGRISTLFEHIRKVNVPPKVTNAWLEAAGFKSSNDRALIGLLKALGYIDGSGVPIADKWAELRGGEADRKASVGRQMQIAYPLVFQNYPISHISSALTKDELKTFIRPKVSFGEPTVANVADTFFALRAQATFDAGAIAAVPPATVTVSLPQPPAAPPSKGGGAVNVAINLSLELPVTSDGDVYDKLFEAMAKHLGALLDRGK